MKTGNIFNNIPAHLPDELIELLVQKKGVRVERIVSRGHSTKDGFWYNQEQDEFVLLISGFARLAFKDTTLDLKPGDYLTIKSGTLHRVEKTSIESDTVWLAVFL